MVETQYDKKIDGEYYTFIDGKMQTGWVEMPKAGVNETVAGETSDGETAGTADAETTGAGANTENAPLTIADYQYYGAAGDGKRANGWRTVEGIDGIHERDEVSTFFFKNGKAYHSKTKGNELFTIDSKKYAFNDLGEMQTGRQVVNLADGEIANFYFGDDGVMKTGKQNIYNWETGSDELRTLYEIMRRTDGVYGGRFSGAGFKGCCMALIDPAFAESIEKQVGEEYLRAFPDLRGKYSFHLCDSADGVSL